MRGYIDDDVSMTISSLEEEAIRTTYEIPPRPLIFQHVDLLKWCVWSEKHTLTEYLERETHV